VNNVVGNVFLCKKDKESILHKKTIRLLIVLVSLSTLLAPCSDCSACCINNAHNQTLPKLTYSSLCFSNYRALIEIYDVETIYVNEKINLENILNTSVSFLNLYYNETISIIDIKEDNQDNSNFSISVDNSLIINFNTILEQNDTKEIIVEYTLENVIQQQKRNYLRLYYEYYKYNITHQETIIVRLPKDSKISDEDGEILPYPDEMWIERGYIEIYWYDSTEDYIQVIFKIQSNPYWIYIIGPIIGLAVGVGGTIWLMRKREEKAMKEMGKIFLTETEKMILKLIYENGGKITQGELSSLTGFTKTKVSRNLISLEKHELIIREKWGRNYRIFISDMGQKVVE